MTRPNFNDIQSFDEFKQYYWYRDELKQICKEHGITHTGTKTELNDNIKAYFNGEIIKSVKRMKIRKSFYGRNSSLFLWCKDKQIRWW